jgi:hypothetical protein
MNQADNINNLKDRLIEICKKFIRDNPPSNVIIEAPYIPYIPQNWFQNQILILFEAQNLSGHEGGNKKYRESLKNLDTEKQIKRLYEGLINEKKIGISPWDEGYLDFPLKVCFPEYNKTDYAVGNSVLWSISKNNKNINPSKELIDKSSELWKLFLEEMKPQKIICVGDIASKVISKSDDHKKLTISTYFPTGRYANFIIKHFDFSKEINRFEEVNQALKILAKNLDSPISEYSKTPIKRTLPMTISMLLKLNR